MLLQHLLVFASCAGLSLAAPLEVEENVDGDHEQGEGELTPEGSMPYPDLSLLLADLEQDLASDDIEQSVTMFGEPPLDLGQWSPTHVFMDVGDSNHTDGNMTSMGFGSFPYNFGGDFVNGSALQVNHTFALFWDNENMTTAQMPNPFPLFGYLGGYLVNNENMTAPEVPYPFAPFGALGGNPMNNENMSSAEMPDPFSIFAGPGGNPMTIENLTAAEVALLTNQFPFTNISSVFPFPTNESIPLDHPPLPDLSSIFSSLQGIISNVNKNGTNVPYPFASFGALGGNPMNNENMSSAEMPDPFSIFAGPGGNPMTIENLAAAEVALLTNQFPFTNISSVFSFTTNKSIPLDHPSLPDLSSIFSSLQGIISNVNKTVTSVPYPFPPFGALGSDPMNKESMTTVEMPYPFPMFGGLGGNPMISKQTIRPEDAMPGNQFTFPDKSTPFDHLPFPDLSLIFGGLEGDRSNSNEEPKANPSTPCGLQCTIMGHVNKQFNGAMEEEVAKLKSTLPVQEEAIKDKNCGLLCTLFSHIDKKIDQEFKMLQQEKLSSMEQVRGSGHRTVVIVEP